MGLSDEAVIYHRWMSDHQGKARGTFAKTRAEIKEGLTNEMAFKARIKENLRYRKQFIKTKEDMEKGL